MKMHIYRRSGRSARSPFWELLKFLSILALFISFSVVWIGALICVGYEWVAGFYVREHVYGVVLFGLIPTVLFVLLRNAKGRMF